MPDRPPGLGRAVPQPICLFVHCPVWKILHRSSEGYLEVCYFNSNIGRIADSVQDDQGPRYRRARQRMPRRTGAQHGCLFCRLQLRAASVPVPHFHVAGLQRYGHVYAGRGSIRVRHRPANLSDIHHAAQQRSGHDFCCHGMGSGGFDEGTLGSVPSDGRGLPTRPAGDSCIRAEAKVQVLSGRKDYHNSKQQSI